MSRGEEAERLVETRLRESLPEPDYRVYVNVNWTGPVKPRGPARDGEADAVITHPEHGLLVLEVKAGEPSVDSSGRWHLGPITLKESPFHQAETSKHVLRAKLLDLPDWPPSLDPLTGHAVAFPDVDLASLPRGNQRLATSMQRDLVDAAAPAGLEVTTFHRLCELIGGRAGTLPARPSPIPEDWFSQALPDALDAAISTDEETRYHAVIVDEGQDFAQGWLESLALLLMDTEHGVYWIFHDPAQALYRPDVVAKLGLERLELFEDHRNPPLVAQMAARFRSDGQRVETMRIEGMPAEVIGAQPGAETVQALRKTLHRLISDEQVPGFRIAVLSGVSAARSEVWKQRTFGNAMLWNEAFDDEGRSKGLPPEQVPDEPSDVVLFETIRRFKGLEREVIILVELPEEGDRLDELMYVAVTRATTHVVAIAPPLLAERLRGTPM